MKANMRYSEAFKLQVVREIEQGRFESSWAAGRAYGVKGAETVALWIRQYGKDHLLRKVVRVMKADEQAEVKALRKRVRDLERALADAHIDLKLEAAYVLDFAPYWASADRCRTCTTDPLGGGLHQAARYAGCS